MIKTRIETENDKRRGRKWWKIKKKRNKKYKERKTDKDRKREKKGINGGIRGKWIKTGNEENAIRKIIREKKNKNIIGENQRKKRIKNRRNKKEKK